MDPDDETGFVVFVVVSVLAVVVVGVATFMKLQSSGGKQDTLLLNDMFSNPMQDVDGGESDDEDAED